MDAHPGIMNSTHSLQEFQPPEQFFSIEFWPREAVFVSLKIEILRASS